MTNPPLSVSKRSLRTKNIYGCFIFVIMFLGKALVVDILSKICKINVISALESVARQRVHWTQHQWNFVRVGNVCLTTRTSQPNVKGCFCNCETCLDLVLIKHGSFCSSVGIFSTLSPLAFWCYITFVWKRFRIFWRWVWIIHYCLNHQSKLVAYKILQFAYVCMQNVSDMKFFRALLIFSTLVYRSFPGLASMVLARCSMPSLVTVYRNSCFLENRVQLLSNRPHFSSEILVYKFPHFKYLKVEDDTF